MRSIAVLLALTIAASWAVVQGLPDGQVHAQPRATYTQEVQSISIDGGRGLPLAQLRSAMATKIGSTVDTQTLAQDRVALQSELAARGFLAAKVTAPTVSYGPTGGVYVVFDVERGPLYHIRSITLDGPLWSKADVVVTLAPGDEAVGARLSRVRQAAQDALARLGKPIRVELDLAIDPDEPLVDVRLVTR